MFVLVVYIGGFLGIRVVFIGVGNGVFWEVVVVGGASMSVFVLKVS